MGNGGKGSRKGSGSEEGEGEVTRGYKEERGGDSRGGMIYKEKWRGKTK